MCTLIASISSNPNYPILFLGNRDRPAEGFKGQEIRILEEGKVVCLYDFRSGGIACGFSLNHRIFGGVANVPGYVGTDSRGLILKDVLTKSKTVHGAVAMMHEALESGTYSSANYLLGDSNGLYRIENFGREVVALSKGRREVATNYFHHIKTEKRLKSSVQRERGVREILEGRDNFDVEALKAIGSMHGDSPVCRHRRTLASLIFSSTRRGLNLYYSLRWPCKGYEKNFFEYL